VTLLRLDRGFEENNICGSAAARSGEGFAIAGPREIGDKAGREVGELLWWATI
jgi:hypothetical protein